MTEKEHKKIIVLPFISSISSPEIKELEQVIIQGIEYKFLPLSNIIITDLCLRPFPGNIKPYEGVYSIKDLKFLAERSSAKYALVGKFEEDKDNNTVIITFYLYNMQISEVIESIECPPDCINFENNKYVLNLNPINLILKDLVEKICNKLDYELDEILASYIDFKLINDLEAFSYIVKAKKVIKTTDEKLEYFKKAAEKDTRSEFAFAEIARILKNKRFYDQAIENYNMAIQTSLCNYNKALYSNEIGSCFFLNGNYQNAFENWEKAIEYNPNYINPYMNLAITYEEREVYKKAEQYYLEVQKREPTDCRSYFCLARLYSKTGNWLKAIDQYKNQLEVNPYDAWSHSNIGNCYLQVGKSKDAKTYFYKTLDLDPDGEAGSYAKNVLESLEESCKRDWWKFWKR